MIVARLIVALFVCLCGLQPSVTQRSELRPPENHDITDIKTTATVSGVTTVQEAFHRVMSGAGVSGGLISWERDCSGSRVQGFYVPSGMILRDALDNLTATDKAHMWAVQDGVVLLLPVQGTPELLKTKISAAHITDRTNLPLALDELLQTREVKEAAAMLSLSLHPGEIGFQKLQKARAPHRAEPMDLNGLSLMNAVNVLARERGGAIWEYAQRDCGGHQDVRVEFTGR